MTGQNMTNLRLRNIVKQNTLNAFIQFDLMGLLLDLNPLPILVTTNQYKIISCNRKTEKLLNINEENLVGTNIKQLLSYKQNSYFWKQTELKAIIMPYRNIEHKIIGFIYALTENKPKEQTAINTKLTVENNALVIENTNLKIAIEQSTVILTLCGEEIANQDRFFG